MHNNYLTLPVLLMMVSHHYPLLSAHPQSWLVVALIIVSGALIRHFLNRIDAGDDGRLRLDGPGCGFRADLRDLAHRAARARATAGAVSDMRGAGDHREALHHVPCAKADARKLQGAAEECRAGDRSTDLRKHAPQILTQTVQNKAMPLGNETGMTDEERQKIGQWIAAQR